MRTYYLVTKKSLVKLPDNAGKANKNAPIRNTEIVITPVIEQALVNLGRVK
jgi:hypothetical protein